jgi:peptide/nickel transport system substrate-binding protein
MTVIHRRLIVWLLKAYVKKWGKSIAFFFLIGLLVFFAIRYALASFAPRVPLVDRHVIGVVGSYTIETLPQSILAPLSRGLLSLDQSGIPVPDAATAWEIRDDGKTIIFFLSSDLTFHDGTPFTSSELTRTFTDATIERPNARTIIYRLNEPFAPFLTTMSRPIFRSGLTGLGEYVMRDIQRNGDFVSHITMAKKDDPYLLRVYQFYPTQEALKLAYVMGQVDTAVGLSDVSFATTSLASFPNTRVDRLEDMTQLVTLFFNYKDPTLSERRLREALVYALPSEFTQGLRAHSPISPTLWAYQPNQIAQQDIEHAQTLLRATGNNSPITLTLTTLPKYEAVAREIAAAWEPLQITTQIVTVSSIPEDFQMFLGNFFLPADPDQYTLWHSQQENNITQYDNKRIDKILEDGRKTLDQQTRMKLYSDFQKYISEDPPAGFLYFPYIYSVSRI